LERKLEHARGGGAVKTDHPPKQTKKMKDEEKKKEREGEGPTIPDKHFLRGETVGKKFGVGGGG